MHINVKGINAYYEMSGEGRDVLILHGWGADSKVMRRAAESFEGKMRVITLDLPGFGKTQEPLEDDWDIYTYADFVIKFCKKMTITSPVIVAHSFGGRIALILAGKKLIDINKMVLTGCAGIKPKRGADYYIKVYTYKLSKKLTRFVSKLFPSFEEKMKKKLGSSDYASASDKMRAIMVRTVNEDLTYLLEDIDVPCLLVWGENDDATPLSDGKLMEQKIRDSGLVVMPGKGHYAFLENAAWFSTILRNFCSKEMEEQK